MAPGVRNGKFSTQNLLNKNYESISASSYLHANPAPLGAPLGAPYNGGEVIPWVSTVDYNKPWFTINEDGEYYCKLCNAFATDGHVASDKHKNREREPEWYMGEGTAVRSAEYNKPWFEDREGQWYCLLCSQWATDGHLAGDKHRKREACPEYYGSWPGQDQAFDAAQACGAASSSMPAMGYGLAVPSASYAAAQPRPNEPWLEVKQGELYCNLCGSWATDGHLSSDKHKRRAAEPEWYWTPPGGASFPDAASSLPAAMASLPALTQNPHGEAQRGRDGLPHGWTKHFPQALGSEGGVGAMSADIFCDVRLCEDLRLLDLAALQQSLEKDKDNLQLYVLKAKQEHEEKKETAAKREQREKEAARRDEVLEAWQELLGRIAAGDLEYAPAELRDIRIVVIKAVKANGRALQYASARLRGDREVVMQAVKQDGHAFPYASEDLRSDVEVVQEAFKEIPLEVTVIDLAGTTLFKLKLSPVLEMRLFSVRDLRKDIQKKLKQSHKEDEDVCQRLNEKWLNATEHQIKLVCGLDVLQDGDRALIHLLQGFPGLVVQMVFRSFDPEYEGDLLRASATGVQAEVDRLLHMAANPNCQDDSGRTALLLAADNGHASTVQCLYEAGADCDKATTLGETPLHMAAWGGHAAVVDYLCEEPKADSSLVMTDGKTALHMAAWSGPVETVKRLCDYHREREQQKDLEGSSGGGPTAQHFEEPDCAGDVSEFLERKTTSGETALHFACWNGHHEIVEYLHGQRANMQQKADDGKMPLHMAAWNGHAETTRLLVEWRADTCDKANDGNAPLHMACWNGHLDIVKILCKEFDSDDLHMKTKDGKTPLHMAAWTGHGRVLEFLLELGQGSGVTEQARQEMLHSKTVDGKTPLHMAGWNGHVDALRVLLEHRADQEIGTIDKKTALHMASWNGHSQAAQVLMHYRADTMAQTEEGLTPLHFAAWNNHLATVQLFLRSQVDKDFQAQDGKTPLHMAAWNGYVRVTRALLASHVDLRKLNEQNETALHMACWNGHLEVARLLIGECVRINWPECKDAQSLDGKTALHMAAWNGHTEVAQLLLREGAQHHLVTRSHNTTVGGQTAAHMAARNGHTQVLRALHEARADLALTAIDPTSPLELARANGHEEARNFLERPDGPRADGPRLAGQ